MGTLDFLCHDPGERLIAGLKLKGALCLEPLGAQGCPRRASVTIDPQSLKGPTASLETHVPDGGGRSREGRQGRKPGIHNNYNNTLYVMLLSLIYYF